MVMTQVRQRFSDRERAPQLRGPLSLPFLAWSRFRQSAAGQRVNIWVQPSRGGDGSTALYLHR